MNQHLIRCLPMAAACLWPLPCLIWRMSIRRCTSGRRGSPRAVRRGPAAARRGRGAGGSPWRGGAAGTRRREGARGQWNRPGEFPLLRAVLQLLSWLSMWVGYGGMVLIPLWDMWGSQRGRRTEREST